MQNIIDSYVYTSHQKSGLTRKISDCRSTACCVVDLTAFLHIKPDFYAFR